MCGCKPFKDPRRLKFSMVKISTRISAAVELANYRMTLLTLRDTSITDGIQIDGANVVDITKVAAYKNLQATMRYIHTAGDRLHDVVANLPTIETL